MASWKKVIVSGSNAELNQITSSAGLVIINPANSTFPNIHQQVAEPALFNVSTNTGTVLTGSFSGSFAGTITNADTASWITSSKVYGPYGFDSIKSASYASSSFSASYALSASWADSSSRAISASYVLSSSYAFSSSYALSSSNALSASYALSSSYALSASNALSSSYALSSSNALSASYTLSSSYALSSSNALSASYALSSSNALSSSYALSSSNALSASFVLSSSYAFSSSYALSASYALSSSNALSASNALSSSYALSSSNALSASNALSSSYSSTASYALNAGSSFPFSGSAVITGSLLVSGSGVTITGSLNVSGTINGTASWAQSASWAVTSSWATRASSSLVALTASNITPAIANITNNRSFLSNDTDGTITAEPNFYLDAAGNTLTIDYNDVVINGSASFVNSQNLFVADQFILLASSSNPAITNRDGGLIVRNANVGGIPQGYTLFLDANGSTPGESRWGLAHDIQGTATSANPDSYLVAVTGSTATWSSAGAAPAWGGTGTGYGNMYIDGNNDIWIYSR